MYTQMNVLLYAMMYVNVQGTTQGLLTYGKKCGKQDCYIIVTCTSWHSYLFASIFYLFFTELKGVD